MELYSKRSGTAEAGNGTTLPAPHHYEAAAPGGYKMAPEVAELATRIIEEHHPYLKEADIVYLFKAGRWCNKGRTITGKALVAPEMWRFVGGCDLVLILSEVIYKNLSAEGQAALIDHELSHFCEPTAGKGGILCWSLRDHDVREFSAVVKRHKICMSNLRALTKLDGDDGGLEQLDMMKSLAETVENEEALAEVYNNPVEIDEDDNLLCEEYEEEPPR
jgi:hypothetical protein